MNIDTHNHVIPEGVLRLLRDEPSYGVRVEGARLLHGAASIPLDRSFYDPDSKLAELNENGLDAAVLSVAPPVFLYGGGDDASMTFCEVANVGLREFAAEAPDKFRWMAHVPMAAPERAVRTLEAAVEAGAAGVEIGTSIGDRALDYPEFETFWAAADRLRLPVFIHPADSVGYLGLNDFYLQNIIGNQFQTTVAIERLICARVLERFPGVRVLLAHAGGYFPFQGGRLRHGASVKAELADVPRDPWAFANQIAVDTITHDVAALAFLVSRMGAANVLLGTDLPFSMATRSPMEDLRKAVDSDTVSMVADANPSRMFGFPSLPEAVAQREPG